MEFFTKVLKTQISIVSKLADGCSVEKSRFAQDKIGELMARKYKQGVSYEKIRSGEFQAEYIIPDEKKLNGIILYLHGGGYVSGGMNYAKGFGTILACQNKIPVCCVAYRLAPGKRVSRRIDRRVKRLPLSYSGGIFSGKYYTLRRICRRRSCLCAGAETQGGKA